MYRRLPVVKQLCSTEAELTEFITNHRRKLGIVVVGEAAKIKADLEKIAPVTVIATEGMESQQPLTDG